MDELIREGLRIERHPGRHGDPPVDDGIVERSRVLDVDLGDDQRRLGPDMATLEIGLPFRVRNGELAEPRFGRTGGDWLFHVGLWTPPDFREELLAWYRHEHLPILLECPLWDGCRFVEQKTDKGCQFYALHQLADKAALDSAERKRSRSTPWFTRLSVHPWFDGAFTRTLCKRLPA